MLMISMMVMMMIMIFILMMDTYSTNARYSPSSANLMPRVRMLSLHLSSSELSSLLSLLPLLSSSLLSSLSSWLLSSLLYSLMMMMLVMIMMMMMMMMMTMMMMMMMMCGEHLQQPSNEILLTRDLPPIAFLPSTLRHPHRHHHEDENLVFESYHKKNSGFLSVFVLYDQLHWEILSQ